MLSNHQEQHYPVNATNAIPLPTTTLSYPRRQRYPATCTTPIQCDSVNNKDGNAKLITKVEGLWFEGQKMNLLVVDNKKAK